MNEALEFLQTELDTMNTPTALQNALNVLNSNAAEPEKIEACNLWVNCWNNGVEFNNEPLTYEAIVTICDTINPNMPPRPVQR